MRIALSRKEWEVFKFSRQPLTCLIALVAMTALMGGGLDPSPKPDPAAAPAPAGPAAAQVPPVSPVEKPATKETKEKKAVTAPAAPEKPLTGDAKKAAAPAAKAEKLPWANAPKTAPKDGAPPKQAAGKPAASACTPLFEASCRETKGCAWLADIALEDGTMVAAHCVARQSPAAKKADPAPKAEAAKGETTAPKPKADQKADAAKETAKAAPALPGDPPQVTVTVPAAVAPVVISPPPATKAVAPPPQN